MEKYGQISITIGALGVVITLIGLFPGIVGLEASEGVGVLQVLVPEWKKERSCCVYHRRLYFYQ